MTKLQNASDGPMKRFRDIYSRRDQDAGWSVVQAVTLLGEAKSRSCSSLVIYAALELRLAVEQLIFNIISVAKQEISREMLIECRKKDALFRILKESSPDYTKRCLFTNVLAKHYPRLPTIAVWDIRKMKRYYTALSDLCHSQLLIREISESPEIWDKKISFLEEIYEFLAKGLRKGTGIFKTTGAHPVVKDLWDKYSKNEISIEDVDERMKIIVPSLAGFRPVKLETRWQ